jgi:hypothetical protein
MLALGGPSMSLVHSAELAELKAVGDDGVIVQIYKPRN